MRASVSSRRASDLLSKTVDPSFYFVHQTHRDGGSDKLIEFGKLCQNEFVTRIMIIFYLCFLLLILQPSRLHAATSSLFLPSLTQLYTACSCIFIKIREGLYYIHRKLPIVAVEPSVRYGSSDILLLLSF